MASMDMPMGCLMFAVDQTHGVRTHHDWWWDLTWQQAAVIVAVAWAVAAVWIAYLLVGDRDV
jgi:hypothetical protein